MQKYNLPRDDLIDIVELSRKLAESVNEILDECDVHIALSALISTTMQCVMSQCSKYEEVFFYREMAIQLMDAMIKTFDETDPGQCSYPDCDLS
jgi:hypothetical protein